MALWRLTIGAALLAVSSLFPMPVAHAGEGEITFCNEFPHKVYVAIAYLQTDVNNYLTRGWLNIETGKCYIFDTATPTSSPTTPRRNIRACISPSSPRGRNRPADH